MILFYYDVPERQIVSVVKYHSVEFLNFENFQSVSESCLMKNKSFSAIPLQKSFILHNAYVCQILIMITH